MEVRLNLPIDVEEVALQIAQHDDKTVVRFVETILGAAARIELDEMLVAHVWRGVLREYEGGDVGEQPPSIQELLDEYAE
jgi:hypothetical protein